MTMATDRAWEELAQQLLTLPGRGPAAILGDFFARTALPAAPHWSEQERWELAEGGTLNLEIGGRLMHYDAASNATLIAQRDTLKAPLGLSPLALMLTALAGGLLDGHPHPAPFKTLKALSPKLARAAQELLLVASCRLCG
jgi:hypothetical protein